MDKNLIKAINRETSQFYIMHASEFSDTRQHAWAGWEKLTKIFTKNFDDLQNIKVLDVGCGNMRFEKFLESVFPDTKFYCTAIDNCQNLQNVFTLKNTEIDFCQVDIIEALLEKKDFAKKNEYDLVVAFGLMHHIPDYNLRLQLIKFLINFMSSHGILAVSFWNYFNDEKLKSKAEAETEGAIAKLHLDSLDLNDRFLTWSNDKSVYRFCHNFEDDEISQIIKDVENAKIAKLAYSYFSDGRTDNLNRYLVFKKLP